MAYVSIKEASVDRLIPGYGLVVTETYTDEKGEDRKGYFTVWTQEKYEVGDVINVRGILGARVNTYTNKMGEEKTVAEQHVNNPKIEKADAPF